MSDRHCHGAMQPCTLSHQLPTGTASARSLVWSPQCVLLICHPLVCFWVGRLGRYLRQHSSQTNFSYFASEARRWRPTSLGVEPERAREPSTISLVAAVCWQLTGPEEWPLRYIERIPRAWL